MNKFLYTGIFLTLLVTSCNVQRYLPQGERLYKGATVHVTRDKETTTPAKSLKKTIKLAAQPRPNKFLLGQPYKVWFWYKIGEPKKEKGLKAFLRNKLGEPPVLSSRINAISTAANMQSLLENIGYFRSAVSGDTTNTGRYFMKADYYATVNPRYTLGKVEWVKDSTKLLKQLQRDSKKRGLLKPGDPYTLSTITAERDRLDLFVKTKGYYFFNPDYLMVYADSTIGKRKVDMLIYLKSSTPEDAKYAYSINKITVFPNYSLNGSQVDTARTGGKYFDGLLIKDTLKKFKPQLFSSTITYRPGRLYSSREQNTTLNRLINLGAFKFVKNKFEAIKDSSSTAVKDAGKFAIMIDTAKNTPQKDTADVVHRLNAFYYLTPARKKSLQAEINAFTKENNYVGSQLSVGFRNRNAFGGAEQLAVKVYGGFETTSGSAAVKNNNFRLGTEVSLKIPKYVIPFFKPKENFFYPPNTSILVGYEWFRKDLFYTKNLFRTQYEFTWKPNPQTQFTVAPIALSYLQATGITDTFIKQAALQPSLLISVFSESNIGSFASYTYNANGRKNKSKIYFMGSADLSGNIAGLLTGAKNYRSKSIFGVPFAQYAKIDLDFHYTKKLPNNFDWANRIQVGLGMPYNNSKLLPYAKLYTIGGSSSIRGFRTRTLGPGTYRPTVADQRFFQVIGGDYKLLLNTELRIPFTKQLSGAVFLDAGNIWTKDTTLFGPLGKLTKDFYKQLAIAGGIGFRFDATILLIRADLGVPIRTPYLPIGQQYVIRNFDLSSRTYRKENLVLNIAIGLPF